MALHPTAIKNTFMSHLVFWVLFLPVLTVIFLPLMPFDLNIAPEELQMVERSGTDMAKLSQTVNGRFSAMFIHTGIMPGSESLFGGSKSKDDQVVALQFAEEASKVAGGWVRGMWMVVYRSMWRIHALAKIYASVIIAICIPALIDGLAVRGRKRYQFENTNPVFFYFSSHTVVLVVGLLVYLPLSPIPLTPYIIAAFMAFLGASIWWASSNFQTGS